MLINLMIKVENIVMKNSFFIITLFFVFFVLPDNQAKAGGLAKADSVFDTEHYDQCIVEGMKGVKIDLVASEIKRICSETYKNRWSVSKKKKQYNECVTTYLDEVESYIAAKEIIKSCRRKYLE